MDLRAELRREAEAVERRLEEYLAVEGAPSRRLVEAMAYSTLGGGKRLRPALCLWAHDARAEERGEAVWRAACALEMVHSYSLIHDDLPAMDDDDLRRGQPSCHRRFDEATAILAGDTLQTEAFGLLAEVQPAETGQLLVRLLVDAIGARGMAAGQQLDLEAEGQPADADHMHTIHWLKTGRLLGAALAMGAACAGARGESLERAREAGEALGIAFQIADDLLDGHADPAVLGKSVGKDAEQGKLTAVAALGETKAREEARRRRDEGLAGLAAAGLASERLCELARFLVGRDR